VPLKAGGGFGAIAGGMGTELFTKVCYGSKAIMGEVNMQGRLQGSRDVG
jgi:hypothetical protein